LNGVLGRQIIGIGDDIHGVRPNDTLNWVMVAVSSIIILVLLLVTIYLVKHKVDHVAEHLDGDKEEGLMAKNGATSNL